MQNQAGRSPEGNPEKSTKRRPFFRLLKKAFLWSLGILLLWWVLSAIIPGLPTPARAGMALLGLMKDVTDDVYISANKEHLEKAARDVMSEAEETGTEPDAATSDSQRSSADRQRRLPAVPAQEDSALRTTLKAISNAPLIRGRVINILLVGVDSRIGSRSARADAIHLFTVNPDSAVVEITSIPRDMYVDLGYPDTTSFNIIANARAAGYPGFLRRVEEIAKRGPIKYYAEVGFSQAMGVLEMLGYKDPVNTLKFLRTRKGLAAGDVQRSHNQAVFLRQSLMSKFALFTGATGDLILAAGLNFVATNMSKDFCQGLVYAMDQRGFPTHRSDAVRLRMPPTYKIRLKDMAVDSATIARTVARNRQYEEEDVPRIDVTRHLRRVTREAIADSNRPGQVIFKLNRIAEQHAWIQIRDQRARVGIRDTLLTLLERAYRKVGKTAEADRVVDLRRSEDVLIQTKLP